MGGLVDRLQAGLQNGLADLRKTIQAKIEDFKACAASQKQAVQGEVQAKLNATTAALQKHLEDLRAQGLVRFQALQATGNNTQAQEAALGNITDSVLRQHFEVSVELEVLEKVVQALRVRGTDLGAAGKQFDQLVDARIAQVKQDYSDFTNLANASTGKTQATYQRLAALVKSDLDILTKNANNVAANATVQA